MEILDNVTYFESNILEGCKIFLKGIDRCSLQNVSICSDLSGSIKTNLITDKEALTSMVMLLKNLLTSVATGGNKVNSEYVKLRTELLNNDTISTLIPNWMKTNRDIDTYWDYIKLKFSTYAERRSFIIHEFDPVLNFLEFDYSKDVDSLVESQDDKNEED